MFDLIHVFLISAAETVFAMIDLLQLGWIFVLHYDYHPFLMLTRKEYVQREENRNAN